MAAVKGRNTSYEIAIRKRLFARGFRYRIDNRDLPGKPDIVLPKYNVIIFVNGCFWHYHECHLSRIPKSRTEWWKKKLEGNKLRDAGNLEALAADGWRILIIWECSFRRSGVRLEAELDRVCEIASNFILAGSSILEVTSP